MILESHNVFLNTYRERYRNMSKYAIHLKKMVVLQYTQSCVYHPITKADGDWEALGENLSCL